MRHAQRHAWAKSNRPCINPPNGASNPLSGGPPVETGRTRQGGGQRSCAMDDQHHASGQWSGCSAVRSVCDRRWGPGQDICRGCGSASSVYKRNKCIQTAVLSAISRLSLTQKDQTICCEYSDSLHLFWTHWGAVTRVSCTHHIVLLGEPTHNETLRFGPT